MPFIFIKGRFKPKVGIPDGDSVRFLANNPALWKKLGNTPVRLGASDKSKHITQAPSLGNIEAIKATTSNVNGFQALFPIPRQERESTKWFLSPLAAPLVALNQPLELSCKPRSAPCG